MKGICTNEYGYYYGCIMEDDFEPEECGYKRCGLCEHFEVLE